MIFRGFREFRGIDLATFRGNSLLQNSLQNVRTIIWLLLCYNIAIFRIIVKL